MPRKLDKSRPNLALAKREAKRAKADHLSDVELSGIAAVAALPEVAHNQGFDLDRTVHRPQNLLVAAFWGAYVREPEATLRLLTRLRTRLREALGDHPDDVAAICEAVANLPGATRECQTQYAAKILGIKEPSMLPVDRLGDAKAQMEGHKAAMRAHRKRMASLRKLLEAHLRLGLPGESSLWGGVENPPAFPTTPNRESDP